MADIPASLVKDLRQQTGAPMMDCKKALAETGGDFDKAVEFLRKKGSATAAKKAGRTTSQGWVGHYIHSNGKIGVLVEVNCETDFVAKNDQFQELCRDLSMQVAAMSPLTVRPEELPSEEVERERAVFTEQVKDKPAEVQGKIVEGKLKKWYSEVCLLEQSFVKDDKKSVQDYINEKIATIGENITVARFVRMQLGGE